MDKHTLIAIDLAKAVFQVCALTSTSRIAFNKQLKRRDIAAFMAKQHPTVVVMEACYSSHYWARRFQAMGHTVKLIPAQHVTPFVRGHKSDRNDALAIAEAAQRPHLSTVPVKSIEQQDIQSLHRIRERYTARRTGLMNQTRGLLSEYGIVAPQGHQAFIHCLQSALEDGSDQLTSIITHELRYVIDEYQWLTERIRTIEKTFVHLTQTHPLVRILISIPGIGPINATAIYSAIGNGSQFSSARDFAVWLGLTPRQSSSGLSFKSAGITKRGDRYLRKQLVHGARALLHRCTKKTDALSRWATQLHARRGPQKAYVALAARLARIAWILLNKQETYRVMP